MARYHKSSGSRMNNDTGVKDRFSVGSGGRVGVKRVALRQRLRPTEGGQAEVLGRADELVQDELRKAEQLVRLDALEQDLLQAPLEAVPYHSGVVGKANRVQRRELADEEVARVARTPLLDRQDEGRDVTTTIASHLERAALAHQPIQCIRLLMSALIGKLQQAVKGLAVAYLDGALQLPNATLVPRGPRQQRQVPVRAVPAVSPHEEAPRGLVLRPAASHLGLVQQTLRQGVEQRPRAPPQACEVTRVRYEVAPGAPEGVVHAAARGLWRRLMPIVVLRYGSRLRGGAPCFCSRDASSSYSHWEAEDTTL
ncbi:hypothetical protein PG996_009753 [Apiospora saccharicola]|uniref:Uncharacterized protein n=1 Tax=Apiospora saccharicola TaxID=335842 RepID=A0ABR1UPP3_9PEZI